MPLYRATFCTLLCFIALCFAYPISVHGVYFTRENWETSPHPRVTSFDRDIYGNWTGLTEDGKIFRQYRIENVYGLHIERFVTDDYAHYIVEGEIVYSLQDLSVHLVQSHNQPRV